VFIMGRRESGGRVSRRVPALLLAATAAAVLAIPPQGYGAPAPMSADDAMQIGVEAYVFGYPLVLMDATRRVMTAVPKANGKKAPVNQFVHAREFPDHTFTDVVGPNASIPLPGST
jgi:hypothetical protein